MVRWSGECQVNVRECQVNIRWSSGEVKIFYSRLGKGLVVRGRLDDVQVNVRRMSNINLSIGEHETWRKLHWHNTGRGIIYRVSQLPKIIKGRSVEWLSSGCSSHSIENVTLQLCAIYAFWKVETVTDLKNVFIQASWEDPCDNQPRCLEFGAFHNC